MKKNIIAFLLSFIFVIILNALDGFSAGPYLLDVTQTEATVAFFLKLPLSGTVLIKGMDNDLEFISAAPSKQHFIRITGLQPGTSYIYEVICGSGEVCTPPGDQTFEIRTAGRTGESFSFVVYGDPRPGNNLTHHVHERIVE